MALCASCASDGGTELPDIIPSAQGEQVQGELEVEIRSPAPGAALADWESTVRVEGGASVFGGVRFLELMLVVDTSQSLARTDPQNHRSAGAIGLVENLPDWSDIRIGVVDFDSNAELVQPLTTDRGAAIEALRRLDRDGRTNLAAGIRTALAEFERAARRDSTRVILLFTDGKSDEHEARQAMERARAQGAVIHTLHLGRSARGAEILAEIARGTGGSFVRVTDPARLPEAFLNLRTTGVERVTLSVNGGPPRETHLVGGTFVESVPISIGPNTIVAHATSLTGQTREDSVTVNVTGPLDVSIESPIEDTLVTDRRQHVRVEGSVDAFLRLPPDAPRDELQLGVETVVIEVGDESPVEARVQDGRFSGRVPVTPGSNTIRAVARTVDGRSAYDTVNVRVRAPGCAELEVAALREGRPALSISERSVEVVLDGSNSMWGRMSGEAKIVLAKRTLDDALTWLDPDVHLSLRAYGHRHAREERVCNDSELLVGFGDDNRGAIRSAIEGLRPRGQTPIAFTLDQVARDLSGVRGERAVVLVTDGLESCGGDPVASARALGELHTPVHVIGFGLASQVDEDPAALEAIARASGGRFVLARSAEELREALAETVGTPFDLLRDGQVVAEGTLGSGEVLRVPEGSYRVRLESDPPREAPVKLVSEETLTLSWQRSGSTIQHAVDRGPAPYSECWDAAVVAEDPAALLDDAPPAASDEEEAVLDEAPWAAPIEREEANPQDWID